MRTFHFTLPNAKISMEESPPDVVSDKSGTIKEKEVVVYARLLDFKQFENAIKAEVHEQWAVKIPKTDNNAGEGMIRVRKTIAQDGAKSYHLTIKNKTKDAQVETTTNCSEQFFTQLAILAEKGMEKQRYFFPIPNSKLYWEIDIYPSGEGKGAYYPWARCELEIKEEIDHLPELPIQTEEVILPEDQQSDEGKAKVDELFDKYFMKPNKYLPGKENKDDDEVVYKTEDKPEEDKSEEKANDNPPSPDEDNPPPEENKDKPESKDKAPEDESQDDDSDDQPPEIEE